MTSKQVMRAAVRVAAAVALTAVVAAGASAQQSGPPPGGGRGMGGGARQMTMLLEGVTLTEAQQKQVDSIRTAYQDRMNAQRRDAAASAGGDAPQRPDSATMAARRKTMQEQLDAVRAVLTADQQKTFDANAERMRQRMRDRGQQGGGGAPPPASSGQR